VAPAGPDDADYWLVGLNVLDVDEDGLGAVIVSFGADLLGPRPRTLPR
jgi:hypothetical protein